MLNFVATNQVLLKILQQSLLVFFFMDNEIGLSMVGPLPLSVAVEDCSEACA